MLLIAVYTTGDVGWICGQSCTPPSTHYLPNTHIWKRSILNIHECLLVGWWQTIPIPSGMYSTCTAMESPSDSVC